MNTILKILNSLRFGFLRSGKVWRGVLIVWFVSLLLVSLVAMPMKSALTAGLGNSTISEQFKNGINIEVFADLRANAGSLGSYFSEGLIMLILICFAVNSFLTGGLFWSLRKESPGFSPQEFFRASAEKFWSFTVISLVYWLLILFLLLLVVIVPVSFIVASERATDYLIINSAILLSSLFLFGVIIILISADYSRAWQSARKESSSFKAINFGFRETFRSFYSSYPMMLIIMLIQVFYMWLVLKLLHGIQPETGAGIVILFLASQFLFILKIFLKTCRYGSITVMMESEISSPKVNPMPDSLPEQAMIHDL
jgi:hypothetical protein